MSEGLTQEAVVWGDLGPDKTMGRLQSSADSQRQRESFSDVSWSKVGRKVKFIRQSLPRVLSLSREKFLIGREKRSQGPRREDFKNPVTQSLLNAGREFGSYLR